MYFAPFAALLLNSVMIWVLYAWVCLGLGWPFVRFFRKDNWQPSDFVWGFWIGLSALLGLLQFIHLFVAINGFAFVLVTVVGLILSLGALPPLFNCVAQVPARRKWAFLLISSAFAYWIADRAAGHPYFYDSGLYHIPAMKWAALYRIVPGLANLHLRLGFASSITLLAAMMDHGFFAGNVAHLLNGFLLTALAVMVVRGAMGFLTDPAAERPDHWVMLFVPLAVIEWGMDPQISSLSTDLATVPLTIASAAAFLQLYSGGIDAQRRHFLAFTCLTLCAASLSVKISAAGFCAPLALGALWGTLTIPSSPLARLRRAMTASSLGIVITALWIVREMILTGYPLFPATLLAWNVDWRVPRAKAVAIQNKILDFARTATEADTRHGLRWFPTWFNLRVGHSWNLFKGSVPFGLGIVCLIAVLFMRPRLKRLPRSWWAVGWMLFAILLGLILWFKTAPETRYCSQLFYLTFGAGAAVLSAILLGQGFPRRRLVPLVLSLAVAIMPPFYQSVIYFHSIRRLGWNTFLPPGPDSGFEYTWIHTGFRTTQIAPGVTLYLPPPGELDRVWDAPLPNAPFLNPDLQMRNPHRLRDGFRDLSLEPIHAQK